MNGVISMDKSNYKVQVSCVCAETDCELENKINDICSDLAKDGYEVMNVSYAVHSTRVFCMYAMIIYKKYRM